MQRIELEDISSEIFSEIYDYIMTGKLSLQKKSSKYINKVIKMASYFMLDNLIEKLVNR